MRTNHSGATISSLAHTHSARPQALHCEQVVAGWLPSMHQLSVQALALALLALAALVGLSSLGCTTSFVKGWLLSLPSAAPLLASSSALLPVSNPWLPWINDVQQAKLSAVDLIDPLVVRGVHCLVFGSNVEC